jgi:hypothetical protein
MAQTAQNELTECKEWTAAGSQRIKPNQSDSRATRQFSKCKFQVFSADGLGENA